MNLTIPEEFPISEKERELFKKKFLIFLAWCGKYGNAVYDPAFLQPTKTALTPAPSRITVSQRQETIRLSISSYTG